MSGVVFFSTGRRKEATARVRLFPGRGEFKINNRSHESYFPNKLHQMTIFYPLTVTNTVGKYDVLVNVCGGGVSGQAGAIRHGLTRALIKADENLKSSLKKEKLLTRDSRVKERKKYGHKKARKSFQFSKR